MELRKNLRNKNIIFYTLTVIICFLLGYFLLASLDKIINPTIQQLYNSIYTVYTEFGMIIFPVLILQTFSNDYKNKNILFYKLMGYNWLKYFLTKVILSFCLLSVPTILGLVLVGVIYNNFSYLGIMIFYFESVICFQVLLECLWGFMFKSLIFGYVVNFAYWLFSIMFATASEKMSFLARYDAANIVYKDLSEYFTTLDGKYLHIAGNCLYTAATFCVVFIIIYFSKRRWSKNGI